MPEDVLPKAYTIRDAVKLTGLGQSTIFELLKAGKLRRCRVGRRVLIPAADIEALLEPEAPR